MSQREDEARALAAIIRAFWQARGRSPLVWVERQAVNASATDERAVTVVRSNMLGGQPRAFALTAVPRSRLKIVSGVQRDSASPFAPLAGIRQRLAANAAVRPSYESHEFREQYARARGACQWLSQVGGPTERADRKARTAISVLITGSWKLTLGREDAEAPQRARPWRTPDERPTGGALPLAIR
jgi:hypothetical protein